MAVALAVTLAVAFAVAFAGAGPAFADDVQPPSVSAPWASATTPTTLTASWGAGTGDIASYRITLHPGTSGQSAQVADVPAGTLSHTFTGLIPGAGYGLGLSAVDVAGNWSIAVGTPNLIILPSADATAPTAPGRPVVSDLTSTSATLTWAAATDNVGVVRYEVWLGYTDVIFLAATVGGSVTTASLTGLQPNTPYLVFVRAFDAAGNQSASPSQTFTTAPPGGVGCVASYRPLSSWPGNFQGEVTVRNSGTSPLRGWTVRWAWPSSTTISQLWNGTLNANSPQVSVSNVAWNGALAPNATAAFGFNAAGPQVVPLLTCYAS